jgi:hypothetical protein
MQISAPIWRNLSRISTRLLFYLALLLPFFFASEAHAEAEICWPTIERPWAELRRESKSMEFTYIDKLCEGQSAVIIANGTITPDTATKLVSFLRENAAIGDFVGIVLNSDGGSPEAGLLLGRTIRRAGLDTQAQLGAQCLSACAYAFLGGRRRLIEFIDTEEESTQTYLGFHRIEHVGTFASSGFSRQELLALIQNPQFGLEATTQIALANNVAFLHEMGISSDLTKMASSKGTGEFYFPNLDDLVRFNVMPGVEAVVTGLRYSSDLIPYDNRLALSISIRHRRERDWSVAGLFYCSSAGHMNFGLRFSSLEDEGGGGLYEQERTSREVRILGSYMVQERMAAEPQERAGKLMLSDVAGSGEKDPQVKSVGIAFVDEDWPEQWAQSAGVSEFFSVGYDEIDILDENTLAIDDAIFLAGDITELAIERSAIKKAMLIRVSYDEMTTNGDFIFVPSVGIVAAMLDMVFDNCEIKAKRNKSDTFRDRFAHSYVKPTNIAYDDGIGSALRVGRSEIEGDRQYQRIIDLQNAGKHRKLTIKLSEFLKKFPTHSKAGEIRNLTGHEFLRNENPREAAKWFLDDYRSGESGLTAPDSLFNLAVSMNKLGDDDRTCVALQEFSEIYPSILDTSYKDEYADLMQKAKCR